MNIQLTGGAASHVAKQTNKPTSTNGNAPKTTEEIAAAAQKSESGTQVSSSGHTLTAAIKSAVGSGASFVANTATQAMQNMAMQQQMNQQTAQQIASAVKSATSALPGLLKGLKGKDGQEGETQLAANKAWGQQKGCTSCGGNA